MTPNRPDLLGCSVLALVAGVCAAMLFFIVLALEAAARGAWYELFMLALAVLGVGKAAHWLLTAITTYPSD